MKTFVRSLLFFAALAAGTNGLMAGTTGANDANLSQLVRQTKALEARAESSADHRTLAADYRQLAQLQFQESSRWAERADWYARFPVYTSDKFRLSTIDHG